MVTRLDHNGYHRAISQKLKQAGIFYVLLTVHPRTVSQIIQPGTQFCLNIFIYLFLFSTCFGHPSAHHQEKITVSMRHWYLSLWVASGLLVGLNPTSRPDTTHTEWQTPVSHRYSNWNILCDFIVYAKGGQVEELRDRHFIRRLWKEPSINK